MPLTKGDVNKVVALRREDPKRWTFATLAKRFGVTAAEVAAAVRGKRA